MIAWAARLAYATGALAYYVYLTLHDWPIVNGWLWLYVDALNCVRALIWPIYLVGTYLFFGTFAIPAHRI